MSGHVCSPRMYGSCFGLGVVVTTRVVITLEVNARRALSHSQLSLRYMGSISYTEDLLKGTLCSDGEVSTLTEAVACDSHLNQLRLNVPLEVRAASETALLTCDAHSDFDIAEVIRDEVDGEGREIKTHKMWDSNTLVGRLAGYGSCIEFIYGWNLWMKWSATA